MPTLFIALQCFQCSTMQVKQQKKSSNKWSCVICNQKQSVRKVFARSFLAKDVRKFVQGFNMSRQFPSETSLTPLSLPPKNNPIPIEEPSDIDVGSYSPGPPFFPKKRSDWTEYLDSNEEVTQKGGEVGLEDLVEPDIEIVTEIPKEMLQKSGLKRSAPSSSLGLLKKRKREENTPIFKPVFSKRKEKTTLFEGHIDSKKCSRETAKQTSKWSVYLEEGDAGLPERGRECLDHCNSWNREGGFEGHFNDQRVEDDVHPDFI